MANSVLTGAKRAKNDEFYTRYSDIEREVSAYLEYDPDVFSGKTVLLPCDDPEWSSFTKYFAQNFERLGLRKLISTSYAPSVRLSLSAKQLTLFDQDDPKIDPQKEESNGRIFILEKDMTGDHKVDIHDLTWDYLEGDGDFRSKEVCALRDDADVIVTNPPFSLFREFLAWIVNADKKFLLIGNKNAVTYKEVFPLIKDNKLWSGVTEWAGGMWFEVPKDAEKFDKKVEDQKLANVPSIWFTNLDHGRRHQILPLMTEADNIKFSKHSKVKGQGYVKYENYDAIEVPYTDAIPSDFTGVMGVPISFLDKYSPEQFTIVKFRHGDDGKDLKLPDGTCPYFRILIQHKQGEAK